ncbi:helix-turn-helix domain-containing protein [Paraburkholderia aspalathi]|uniref:helix-turn-helix domain-containing protein n=1 Tax=Paraburkholderia aspalathi TaxID=1324617 RepID=UPI00190D7532|nr:helix-turn-helix transcriptional regulator [Paraburkholderia aspalathi]MBK3843794.1 helix-turn-helix domain-containing protein [Paraburkholderia aspalathi]
MPKPIGIFLRSLRVRAGLRQQELADGLGYDASHVSGVEVGRKNPSREYLARIANYLRLGPDDRATLQNELADSPTSIQLTPDLPTDEYRMYAELGRKVGRLSPAQIEMVRRVVGFDDELRLRPACAPQRIKRRSKEGMPM